MNRVRSDILLLAYSDAAWKWRLSMPATSAFRGVYRVLMPGPAAARHSWARWATSRRFCAWQG